MKIKWTKGTRTYDIYDLCHYVKKDKLNGDVNFDDFKGKDCVLMADWLKTKGLHKLCSVFQGV